MFQKGFFLIASILAVVSCGQSQEVSSNVSDLKGNIPSFEEFLNQEDSKKEDSSLENLLTQEESLKRCEEKKTQKKVLLDLCKKGFAGVGATKKCTANCENGSWKIKEEILFFRDL